MARAERRGVAGARPGRGRYDGAHTGHTYRSSLFTAARAAPRLTVAHPRPAPPRLFSRSLVSVCLKKPSGLAATPSRAALPLAPYCPAPPWRPPVGPRGAKGGRSPAMAARGRGGIPPHHVIAPPRRRGPRRARAHHLTRWTRAQRGGLAAISGAASSIKRRQAPL